MSVLHIDFRGCKTDEEMLEVGREAARIERENPGLVEIIDFTGTAPGIEWQERLHLRGLEHRKKYVKCAAMLGIRGVKKYTLKHYLEVSHDTTIRVVDTMDEALALLKRVVSSDP